MLASGAGLWLVATIALPLLLAALAPLWGRMPLLRDVPWLVPLLTALASGVSFALLWAQHGEVVLRVPWIAVYDIHFSLRLDGLAFMFCMMVTGIGAAILAFAARYVPHDLHHHHSPRKLSTFYGYVLFFMGSMLGVACADELITLYAFWEATSVSSFLLISLHLSEAKARAGATKAFSITASAGLLLFVAFLLMAMEAGSTSLEVLRQAGPLLAVSPLAPLIVVCVVIGAGAKSAQVPFQIWLPDAMVAPTPVSAYLHSATMVAAGVFLFSRLAPVLSPVPGFSPALVVIGAITMVYGGLVAITRNGLKEVLAYSTISQYGYITLLLGLQAWGPALFLIGNHAVIKAGLFLSAGLISYTTGQTDLRQLGGLWRTHPVTMVISGLLALALAAVPLTSGFWMKELLFQTVVATQLPWLEAVALTAGVLTFVYMLRFWWRAFFAGPGAAEVEPEGHLLPMLIPTGILAALVLAVGLVPAIGAAITDLGAASTAAAPVATTPGYHLDRALVMSLVNFALGGALFAWLQRRDRLVALAAAAYPTQPASKPSASPGLLLAAIVRRIGPRQFYEWLLPALDAAGTFVARAQTGKLLHYLLFLTAVPVALGAVLLPQVASWPELVPPDRIDQGSLAFATLAIAAVGLAIASVVVHSHVAAILMVGGVGFVIALIFTLLRAPDVALVQVAVETVLALLLFIVLSRIRITAREEAMSPGGQRSRAYRVGSVVVAVFFSTVVAAAILALQANLGDPALSRSFFVRSDEMDIQAVVTAILVEFRGIDTFGEITVFAAAVLGAILLSARGKGGKDEESGDA